MDETTRHLVPLLLARAAEAARAADALLELLHLDHVGGDDALEHQLGDAVALLDLVVGLGVVEEQHLDLPAVVGVDDARARVDEVLGREAGAGGDAAVYPKENQSVSRSHANSLSQHNNGFLEGKARGQKRGR